MKLNNIDRPYGCRCQTLAYKLVGDGCVECNPEYSQHLDDDEDGGAQDECSQIQTETERS